MVDNGFSHGRASLLLAVISSVLILISFFWLGQASVAYSFAELMGAFLVYFFVLRRHIIVRSATTVGPPKSTQPARRLPPPQPVKVSVEVETE